MSGDSAGVTAFTSLGRKKQGNEVAGFVSFPRADGSEGDVLAMDSAGVTE